MFAAAVADAETIILKNGTFVEGDITLQTSASVRIKTRFGERSYTRKEIEQIIESVHQGDADAANKFSELPPAHKAVLNAQAFYDLKQYDRALERLEPLRDYQENKAVRMRVDWLTIELNERLGKWDVAKKLLQDKMDHGTPPEKIRAKAHLDIFEVNPDFDLRFIDKRPAREFIRREELRNRAREPQSLRDAEIMQIALEEYCEQLLRADKLSVKSFAEKLKPQSTFEAIKKATGGGDFLTSLPYVNDLKAAEAALLKAQAILGEYGAAYELDLLRAELTHLLDVGTRLLTEVSTNSPETYTPAADARTGQLTADGRREWQRRCDEYLKNVKPLERLLDYMRRRAERYPRELNQLQKVLADLDERITQTIKAVKKARDRTHV